MNKLVRRAFTLIELLVVIAIVGILSGLIVVSMGGMTTKATIAKSQVFSNSLRNALMANLVSEWKFDGVGVSDGSIANSTYAQDTWGSNSGTINGSPYVYSGANCIYGSCLYFNGGTDCLTFANPLLGSSEATMCSWIKRGTFVENAAIFSDYDSSNRNLILGYESPEGRLYFYIGSGTSSDSISFTGFTGGAWHYVCGTFVGLGELSIYFDGVKKNYKTTTIAAIGTTQSATHYVGRYGGYSLNGYIDEVRAFSKSFPSAKIKEQYYAGLNKLFANGGVSNEEYISRINEVTNKTAEAK